MFLNWFRPRALEGMLGAPVEAHTLGQNRDQQDGSEGWRTVVVNATAFASRDAVPPQIVLRYRQSDRLVWSVRMSNLGLAKGASVAGVRVPCDVPALRQLLGEASRSLQVSFAARCHWFDRDRLLYVVEERTAPDEPVLGPMRAVGACLFVTVADLSLAPAEFDDGWLEAKRTLFVRFPGSHAAFLDALGAALPLTELVQDRRGWSASCGSARLRGFFLNGIEQIKIDARDGAMPSDQLAAFVDRAREVTAALGTLM